MAHDRRSSNAFRGSIGCAINKTVYACKSSWLLLCHECITKLQSIVLFLPFEAFEGFVPAPVKMDASRLARFEENTRVTCFSPGFVFLKRPFGKAKIVYRSFQSRSSKNGHSFTTSKRKTCMAAFCHTCVTTVKQKKIRAPQRWSFIYKLTYLKAILLLIKRSNSGQQPPVLAFWQQILKRLASWATL